MVAGNRWRPRRASARAVSDGSLARVLLRAFGRSRVHDGCLRRESCVVGIVDTFTASLRLAMALGICFRSRHKPVLNEDLRRK